METIPRLSVKAHPVIEPAMQTLMPLAVVSLGHATLTWTRQALAVRPDKAAASRPDNIVFNFICFTFLFLPNPPGSDAAPGSHPGTGSGVSFATTMTPRG